MKPFNDIKERTGAVNIRISDDYVLTCNSKHCSAEKLLAALLFFICLGILANVERQTKRTDTHRTARITTLTTP